MRDEIGVGMARIIKTWGSMESRLGVGALPCTEAERRLGRHRLVANHYLS